MSIHLNSFVTRQTKASGFSHWEISNDELIQRVQQNLHLGKQGYKDGVLLVPVAPDGFFSAIVQLQAGDVLIGEYVCRKNNEDPRKSTYSARGNKIPARRVDVVLYRHDVLAENNENETETEATWEIVSVNASPTEEETPIAPSTLIANHLQLSGGTATNMSDAEFVQLLTKSVAFWKDKANAAPEHLQNLIFPQTTKIST